jgi:trigger factor
MNVVETKVDDLSRQYKVAISAQDLEQKVDAKLVELSRTAKMSGFRPGKVPMGFLRRRYGPAVKSEALEEAISETSQSVIRDRGLRPAGTPKIAISQFSDSEGVEYILDVELLPEVEVPDLKSIELERLVADVEEDAVDRSLDRIAKAMRDWQPITEPRPSLIGDMVVFDVLGPDDRQLFQGKSGQDATVEVQDDEGLPDLSRQLAGLSAGQQTTITVNFPPDFEVEAVAGKSETYEIQVKEIRAAQPVAIDDAFATGLGVESLDQLKGQVRERHERELKNLSRLRLKRALLDQLAQRVSFGLPKGLVEREYESIARQMQDEQGRAEGDAHGHAHHDHAPGHGNDHDHTHDHHHDHTHDHDHTDDHGHNHHHGHDHDHAHGDDHHHHEGEGATPQADPVNAGLSEADKAEYRALAERRVRLGLLLAEVGQQNGLAVTPEEIARAVTAEARRYPGQEKMIFDFYRGNAQAREAIAAPILEDKVVDFILELATVHDRKVSVPDLLRDPDEETKSSDSDGVRSSSVG